MSDNKITVDSTRVIIKRYAKKCPGNTLKSLAKYLTKERRHNSYKEWVKKIKKYRDTAEDNLDE